MKKKMNWKKTGLVPGLVVALGAFAGLGGCARANTTEADRSAESKASSEASSVSSSQAESAPSEPAAVQPTLTDFLRNALIPKDEVLYVWGGGWNEEDTGGNEESNSIGTAASWKEFYDANINGYIADEHKYEIHDGLDCSGYVGWVLYNTLSEKQDYVVLSHQYDEFLSGLGYGEAVPASEVTEILPGDIMTSDVGHVYIALGQFEDGSVLLLHSSPPGVRMSGTQGIAYETALLYQNSGWDPLADDSYLAYDQFRFNENTLPDPDHLREMTTAQVVDFLYGDPASTDDSQYSQTDME